MRHPFTWLDSLGPGAEGHEISLHNVFGIGRVEPHGERPGEIEGGGREATRVSERWRFWKRNLGH